MVENKNEENRKYILPLSYVNLMEDALPVFSLPNQEAEYDTRDVVKRQSKCNLNNREGEEML